jgi:hypothetical protein
MGFYGKVYEIVHVSDCYSHGSRLRHEGCCIASNALVQIEVQQMSKN